jgi:hypothetical protein
VGVGGACFSLATTHRGRQTGTESLTQVGGRLVVWGGGSGTRGVCGCDGCDNSSRDLIWRLVKLMFIREADVHWRKV